MKEIATRGEKKFARSWGRSSKLKVNGKRKGGMEKERTGVGCHWLSYTSNYLGKLGRGLILEKKEQHARK